MTVGTFSQVLAGGTARMPSVQSALVAVCPDAPLCFGATAEAAVATGCALSAAMLGALPTGAGEAGGDGGAAGVSTCALHPAKRLPRALAISHSATPAKGGGGSGGGDDGAAHTLLAEARAALPLRRVARFTAPAAGDAAALLLRLVGRGHLSLTSSADTYDGGRLSQVELDEHGGELREVAALPLPEVPASAAALEVELWVGEDAGLTLSGYAQLETGGGGREDEEAAAPPLLLATVRT